MKATQQQTMARAEDVVRILLAGAKFMDIREYVSEKAAQPGNCWTLAEGENPLSDAQLRRYQRKALNLISASTKETRRKRIERHVAQRQYLYAQAVAAADYCTALAILDSEAKLFGLDNLELRKELDELRAEIAEAKKNADAPATGEAATGGDSVGGTAAGEPDPGPAAGGPGDDLPHGGDDAGPLAGDVAPLPFPPPPAAGDAAGG
jgi:hypothetical protein